MLIEVFSYIPDHLAISAVCKKFYEISCVIKAFRLRLISMVDNEVDNLSENISLSIYNRAVYGVINQLNNVEVFDSMMNSNRKIKCLEISANFNYNNSNMKFSNLQNKHLVQVLQKFGDGIVELQMAGVEVSQNLFKFLDLMPNLEKIVFFMVTARPNVKISELQLIKLSDITCVSCCQHVFRIFDQLPPSVLHKIKIGQREHINHETTKLFKNQISIKEVEVSENLVNLVDWKQLKLTSLHLHPLKFSMARIIENQNELTSLTATINQNELKYLCNSFMLLEKLEISVSETYAVEFSEISNLKNLKKFHVTFSIGNNRTVNDSLKLLQTETLTSFDLKCNRVKVLPTTISQLGINCPNIRNFKVNSNSSPNLTINIFESFQKLEGLNFSTQSFQPMVFKKTLENGETKMLQVQEAHDSLKNKEHKYLNANATKKLLQKTSLLKSFLDNPFV